MLLVRAVQCSRILRPIGKFAFLRYAPSILSSNGALRTKWLSGKDAEGPEIAVGPKSGADDDPITNTTDKPYLGEPDDPPLQMYYREAPPQSTTRLENLMITLTSSLLWGWFVYHLYYNYGDLIVGEYYIPSPEEFSDEELGIPPDDAPDPEYWGDHPLSRGM
ncbi:NADH-ubiquinone oxidoreductase AGGG subunit homolog, mitochondrialprecursor, putative [Brugia malayi]|uniref:NADH-ubiquinone oxidoreductase AGGG subunit homolog, mitochondrialprecursor, putative n=1 Tax=Brugia malayi TaxID=6279 RepID=A0A4E9FAC6_BRUMA|nr:NADH-ubiquinone oxidoreductase AGGG subunit homolog, mitochondrialprecursor, putative [Brugia malayi]VIO93115.1 NADH-ubiquinone oxidoreductase AGGG subunit homolog, mitochondrialprecursor, putative [Brugia malayi]